MNLPRYEELEKQLLHLNSRLAALNHVIYGPRPEDNAKRADTGPSLIAKFEQICWLAAEASRELETIEAALAPPNPNSTLQGYDFNSGAAQQSAVSAKMQAMQEDVRRAHP